MKHLNEEDFLLLIWYHKITQKNCQTQQLRMRELPRLRLSKRMSHSNRLFHIHLNTRQSTEGTLATMCRIRMIHRHQRRSCSCFTGWVGTAVNKAGDQQKIVTTDGRPLHQNGFIVLFPESLGYFKTWDLGAGGSSSDLSFVDDMIGWASTNYNISESQIFTTGHSWGLF